jgi:hypothetical protein
MNSRGFGRVWADRAGFESVMRQSDRRMGDMIRAAGLART